MSSLLHKEEVYAVVGAAMEVYNVLGRGFHEPVYQEALELELADRKIPFHPQHELRIHYKHHLLEQKYKPDFIAYDKIVIEIKALDRLTSTEDSQLLNYLKATGMEVGILINFGAERDLQWKRMVLTKR